MDRVSSSTFSKYSQVQWADYTISQPLRKVKIRSWSQKSSKLLSRKMHSFGYSQITVTTVKQCVRISTWWCSAIPCFLKISGQGGLLEICSTEDKFVGECHVMCRQVFPLKHILWSKSHAINKVQLIKSTACSVLCFWNKISRSKNSFRNYE